MLPWLRCAARATVKFCANQQVPAQVSGLVAEEAGKGREGEREGY